MTNATRSGMLIKRPKLFSETALMISLLLLVFVLNITLRKDPFQSDESIYAYSAYAISRGVVPYSGIQLAQPPLMYLTLALLINLVGATVSLLNLVKAFMILMTGILIYIMAKQLRQISSNSIIPLLSLGVYSFITFVYFYTTFMEIFLTFSILLCTAVYVLFVLSSEQHNRPALFLVGILIGFSFMIKYSTLLFSTTLFLFNSIWLLLKKERKRALIDGALLCIGAAIPVVISIVLVTFVWGAFGQFYLQSIYWQTVRWPMTLDQRFYNILLYVTKFIPLLILGGIGTFLIYKKTKRAQPLFFAIIFITNTVGLIILFNTFFLHYLYYLSPFLALLSSYGFTSTLDYIRHNSDIAKRKLKKMALFLLFITVITMAIEVGSQFILVSDFPDDNTHRSIGLYISQITAPEEKIWTSEGAIAFFAQRLIASANSSDWPIQCAFSDIFAYDFGNYMGASMKDYKNGVISPEQFTESWEANKIKVLVIIRGTDWVPYPDELLWSGFRNRTGVSNYVQEKYLLNQTFISAGTSHTYEVWTRK
jgi:4-amino-4-deoxy-L-arabinose transferase-like glycosyltransferase